MSSPTSPFPTVPTLHPPCSSFPALSEVTGENLTSAGAGYEGADIQAQAWPPSALRMASRRDAGARLCHWHLGMKAVVLEASLPQNRLLQPLPQALSPQGHESLGPDQGGSLAKVNARWPPHSCSPHAHGQTLTLSPFLFLRGKHNCQGSHPSVLGKCITCWNERSLPLHVMLGDPVFSPPTK